MKLSSDKITLSIGAIVLIIIVLFLYGPVDFSKQTVKETSLVTKGADMPAGELLIEDLQEGSGQRVVEVGDDITIHYRGTLTNGEVFDSSIDRGEPFKTRIGVGQVIAGWDEGVLGMKVGGKRKLTVPPDKAYGNRAIGSIPANSTLIFELELLSIDSK